jgi:hypothetical protein
VTCPFSHRVNRMALFVYSGERERQPFRAEVLSDNLVSQLNRTHG